FDAPLPQLETLFQGDAKSTVGLELVDAEGRPWLDRHPPERGLGPYYNPLDPRVQQAMTNVVREIAGRYGRHASFGGVVVQLSPRGYAMLPAAGCGYDDRTFARFVQETKSEFTATGAERFAERARWCAEEGREAWSGWRAQQMTRFYQALTTEVRQAKPESQLVLTGAAMLDCDAIRRVMQPGLLPRTSQEADARAALLDIGFDGQQLHEIEGLSIVMPAPILPNERGERADRSNDAVASLLHSQLHAAGSLTYREPVTHRVASFDAASPFGRERTFTWLAPQVSPAGAHNRRRFIDGLVHSDSLMVFDGGWTPARGQEDAVLDLFHMMAHLPAAPLASAPTTPATQPLLVRTRSDQGSTTCYVANDSPWPITARLRVAGTARVSALPLADGLPTPLVEGLTGKQMWTVQLEPYAAAAARFNAADVALEVDRIDLPEALLAETIEQLRVVRGCATALKSPPAQQHLINPGFELGADRGADVVGWLFAQSPDVDITLAEGGHRDSGHALKVVSHGPDAWVRSEALPAPKTGRIAVWARLRVSDAQKQPTLRLAIEARRGREPYYRYAHVGAGSEAPLAETWAPFILQIDDLPTDGLDEFRIGFDLIGEGEVWIDDVEAFDLSFTQEEQFQLSRMIAAADFHLREKNVAAAANVLQGYWPQFLVTHVQPAAIERAAAPASRTPEAGASAAPVAAPPRQSMLDRWKGWLRSPF
ncbi:MAG: family 10 glycosylhydrolase, partial [Planctomycetales bacterium]|nr:family 10 glycosylhydrolase [Planctomycetales bacterium]